MHFLLCITIDIDPDGLSGKTINRGSSSFKSFEKIYDLPELLNLKINLEIPITWFVRIDDQIEEFFNDRFYLLNTYQSFFDKINSLKHEIGWHPHLYKKKDNTYLLPVSDEEACDLILKNHSEIKNKKLEFNSFRNGEGWHTTATMNLLKKLGYQIDSTALPGIHKSLPHLMDWTDVTNKPYSPSNENYKKDSLDSSLIEIPMNTWLLNAPYDKQPKLRYINPAVHENLFNQAIEINKTELLKNEGELKIITFITHPDEITERNEIDALYAFTKQSFINNILSFIAFLKSNKHSYEFCTLNSAKKIWKKM